MPAERRQRGEPTVNSWSVLIEALGSPDAPSMTEAKLGDLMDFLGDTAVGSYGDHTYAARFSVVGESIVEALNEAVSMWGDAVLKFDLPEWPIVRLDAARHADIESEFAQLSRPRRPA